MTRDKALEILFNFYMYCESDNTVGYQCPIPGSLKNKCKNICYRFETLSPNKHCPCNEDIFNVMPEPAYKRLENLLKKEGWIPNG